MHPLVSVCVVSYNHAKFIKQCLESIFMQDYPRLQLVISDDCSPDGTAVVIEQVIRSCSADNVVVKFIRNSVNLGAHDNVLQAIDACDGDYIAFCEGDDYWLDSTKVSSQVSILQNKSACSAVTGLALIKKKDGLYPPTSSRGRKVTLLNYILGFKSEMRLCSLIVRRSVINDDFKRLAKSVYAQDNLIRLVALKQGHIYVLGKITSVYRNEGQGEWNSLEKKTMRKKHNHDSKILMNELSDPFRIICSLKKVIFNLISFFRGG